MSTGMESYKRVGCPAAIALGRVVQHLDPERIDPMIVVKTARFHALFGALPIPGVLAGIVISG